MPDQGKDQLIKENSKMHRRTVDATTVGPILSGYGAMSLKLAPKDVLAGVVLVCGTITAIIGGLVLVGWVLGWGVLTSVRTDYIPMAPNTAILFTLLGIALVVGEVWPANHIIRTSVNWAGLLTLIVTGMSLIGSAFGLNLEIGHWLLPSTGTFGGGPIGRMSPISSFSFIFSGAALLLLGRQTRDPAGILGAVVMFVGWVNVTGYCFGDTPLFYSGDVIPMALPTSLAFMLLGAGLIAVAGSQAWPLSIFSGSSTRACLLRGLLPAILVIVLIEGWLNARLLGKSDTIAVLGSAVISVVTVLAVFLVISGLSSVIGDKIDQAEQELRESEDKDRMLTDNMQDVIWQLTPDLVFSYISPSDKKQRGYEAYEVLGRSMWEFITPASQEHARKKYADRIRDLAENKKINDTVYQVEQIRKDGTTVWTELLSTPLLDSEGNLIAFQGVTRDITERKKLEEAIRSTIARLKEAQRLARIGSWELDLVTKQLFWSDEVYRIFEIEPGEFGGSYEAFLALIHPEDRERVDRAYTDSLANKTPYEIVHRLLFSDGRVKYVQERCEHSYDAAGVALRSIGTVQDITELTQAQLRLEKERAHLRTLLQTIPDLIWLKNPDGIYLNCNARFERFFGAKEAEIVGKTDYD
ncbi:MAG: PAS domain-containing protein, partial [Desulfomonilaceae bacterium]